MRDKYFVRAKNCNGKFDSYDVLDLEEESFRVFVLDRLEALGTIVVIKDKEDVEPYHYRVRCQCALLCTE